MANALVQSIKSNKPISEFLVGKSAAELNAALTEQDKALNTPLHWAVYAKSVVATNSIMYTAKTVDRLLETVSLIQDDNGNTPFGASLYQQGGRDVPKVMLQFYADDGALLLLVLTSENTQGETPLERMVLIDDAEMFRSTMKTANLNGAAKQLLSLTNANGKTVAQIAEASGAHKIQAYVINSKAIDNVLEQLSVLETIVVRDGVLKAQQVDSGVQAGQQNNVGANAAVQQLQQAAAETRVKLAALQEKHDNYVVPPHASPQKRGALTKLSNQLNAAQEADDAAQAALLQAQQNNVEAGAAVQFAQNQGNHVHKQTQKAYQSLQTALVINKLPQLVDDLNALAKQQGFDLAKNIGVEDTSYIKPGFVTTAGLVASAILHSKLLLASTIFQNQWIQDSIEEHCGTVCVAPLNALFTTGLVVFGAYAQIITVPVAGMLLVIQAANYGLNYVAEDSPLVLAKPAVELASHVANIAMSPFVVLKLFDAIHMVRSMKDSFGENSEQYAQVYANLMQTFEKLTPADVEFIEGLTNVSNVAEEKVKCANETFYEAIKADFESHGSVNLSPVTENNDSTLHQFGDVYIDSQSV